VGSRGQGVSVLPGLVWSTGGGCWLAFYHHVHRLYDLQVLAEAYAVLGGGCG
jgi:hypothetical protein